jgi:hypothetical protein
MLASISSSRTRTWSKQANAEEQTEDISDEEAMNPQPSPQFVREGISTMVRGLDIEKAGRGSSGFCQQKALLGRWTGISTWGCAGAPSGPGVKALTPFPVPSK